MKLLEDRILKDGIVREGNVLKVDSFVNHQIDVDFIAQLAKEFKRLTGMTPTQYRSGDADPSGSGEAEADGE